MISRPVAALLAAAALAVPAVAEAQDDDRPWRWRVAAGPQVVPDYPGADGIVLRPFLDVSRARGDDPFRFEAADETAGLPLIQANGFAIGPSLGFEGERSRRDTDGRLPKVGFTVEAGGFVQYQPIPAIRLRGEVRHGIGGHEGLIGNLLADFVARDGDRWLIAAGPRATFTNGRYQRAYFEVRPGDAATAGLRAYRPDGGLQAVGAAISGMRQLDRRWSLHGFVKYDRLVDDPARSPIVRSDLGSRNQFSGGLALGFTFGG